MGDVGQSAVHDRAVILSTGDELMTGQLQDSNARWLSEQLVDLGVRVVGHEAVGDDLEELDAAIQRAAGRAPLIIMSGGLGPTDGDLTREAICRASGDSLILDAEVQSQLRELLARRGRELTPRQERQAYRPTRADVLTNAFGTAPGLWCHLHRGAHVADIVCLPGPPGELRPMFREQVIPLLRLSAQRVILTRLLFVVGLPEADCAQRLADLTGRDQTPLVGMTASGGVLTIRMRYDAAEQRSADGLARTASLMDSVERSIRTRLGAHVLPGAGSGTRTGIEHLVEHVLRAASTAPGGPLTLAVVESCTGGMLGELLTSIPGASEAFAGGFITYANALKQQLGVSQETLAACGAVSCQTAREMAEAGRRAAGARACVSLTGIAGPDGGTPAKPVGTVHIGLASDDGGKVQASSRQFLFTGDREDIRRRACTTALVMLHFHLAGHPPPSRLLWEVAAPTHG